MLTSHFARSDFLRFDKSGDGYIDYAELTQVRWSWYAMPSTHIRFQFFVLCMRSPVWVSH